MHDVPRPRVERRPPGTRSTTLTLVPARLDRLPWTAFHWSVIVALGVSWILDGLEIQIVAANGYAREFHMTSADVGALGTVYLIGEVVGALVFGRLADRLGRKRLFLITLLVYLVGSGVGGLSPTVGFLFFFRFIAGAGIGGEYAAINSAIDELIPSRYRGQVDIAVNGTYWAGAALGAGANLVFLNPDLFSSDVGWRLAFFIGPILGLVIIFLRRNIPESPRWLLTHGRSQQADDTVDDIELRAEERGRRLPPVDASRALTIDHAAPIPFRQIWHVLWRTYPRRTITGLAMMITQSVLYNAVFFTYALVLTNFYHVELTGLYFFPFAVGNLIGPLVLGRLFDSFGRRRMIFLTYVIAGAVLAVSAALFETGSLTAMTQTILWSVAFFFASAGASSAYLTVSEIFPLEIRSQVVSYFFAVAQIFGSIAPVVYGFLVGDGTDRFPLVIGYFIGAGVMVAGGIVAFVFGVDAERKSLEAIAVPLSARSRK